MINEKYLWDVCPFLGTLKEMTKGVQKSAKYLVN